MPALGMGGGVKSFVRERENVKDVCLVDVGVDSSKSSLEIELTHQTCGVRLVGCDGRVVRGPEEQELLLPPLLTDQRQQQQ